MIELFFKTALRDSGLFEGVQIHSIVMPQGYNYPAIIFNRISATDEGSKNVKVGHLTNERWSFGIYAKTINVLKQLEASVKLTFDQTENESFNIQSIYFADTSSDFYDEEFEVYSVNVDFYVRRIIDSEAGDLSNIVNPALTIFSKTYLITGTGVYNPLSILDNWEQPDGYSGNCAIVQFTDGNTVFYTYDGGWVYDFKIESVDEPKIYKALMTQTSRAAPTVTVLKNTIGNIIWSRDGDGLYRGTLIGAFPIGKTLINFDLKKMSTEPFQIGAAETDSFSENIITVRTGQLIIVIDDEYTRVIGSDDVLFNTPISIEVYP